MSTTTFRADRTQTSIFTILGLLLFGGILLGVGWVYGAFLLWRSSVWTRREKLAGMLVLPFGLFGSLLIINLDTGRSLVVDVILALATISPLVTCSYLGVVGRRRILA